VLEVDIDRIKATGGGDHRDVRRAQLVDAHAQHQLVGFEHLFGTILADLRGHGISPKPVLPARSSPARPAVATGPHHAGQPLIRFLKMGSMPLFSPPNRKAFTCPAARAHWPKWCAALLGIAPIAIIPSFAAGQPGHLDIGHSIFVANLVDGQIGDTPPTLLRIGDDIVFQEDISTGADAKTVIKFRDGSTFEVGPDAVIRIDEFVFNPEESVGHKTLSVTRGVFRYVSGFVANDQDAKIALPEGTIGIRGSVVVGIVDPAVPAFLHVAQGNATFTNDAGSSAIAAGQSIAIPSRTTPPMRPDAMPAAVAAQTLQTIEPPPTRGSAAPLNVQGARPSSAAALIRTSGDVSGNIERE
jgi:FecR protein